MGRTAIQIGRGKLGHIRATAPTGQHLTPFFIELNNWEYSYLPSPPLPHWMGCLSSAGFPPMSNSVFPIYTREARGICLRIQHPQSTTLMVTPSHLPFTAWKTWQLFLRVNDNQRVSVVLSCYMELLGLTRRLFLRKTKLECNEQRPFPFLISLLWSISNLSEPLPYNTMTDVMRKNLLIFYTTNSKVPSKIVQNVSWKLNYTPSKCFKNWLFKKVSLRLS